MPFVTDTHPLVWYLTGDSRLPNGLKKIFEEEYIFVPCIVFFELIMLIEKKRMTVDFDGFVSMVSSSQNFRVEPLCLPIIRGIRKFSREEIEDPWDRMIAATSLHLNLPLITKDQKIKKVGIETIWD